MPFTLNMPKLTPTMEGGTIVKWHKKEGEEVKDGDLLFEVATDKATVEYNAIDEGFLRKIVIQEGQDARINQPVAIFTEALDENIEGFSIEEKPKSEEEAPKESEKKESSTAAAKAPASSGLQEPASQIAPPLKNYRFEWETAGVTDRILASPLARSIAKKEKIDLTSVKGSGPSGRIMKRDLKTAQKGAVVSFGSRSVPEIPPGTYEEEPLSPIRKIIGERLQASKTFIPHFYVQSEINAKALMEVRAQLKNSGVKVTFNDFIVRATALALRQHPTLNSGYNSSQKTILRFKTIDISVAVSFEGGLITPIIRHADYKNLGQLSQEVRELAALAKEGKLAPEQYQGGSFTISNLGMYGIHDFQAVINPPQVAILAVGSILEKPVVQNGEVIPGHILPLSLSSDHRVVDGADAALFMKSLKGLLENPSILLL
ncbi:MAG: pyruvate dehydrogenase complex dihydrolipoamide acetyltransferase [Simkaniaceae bacterium]